KAAGAAVSVQAVADRAMVLSVITGLVALTLTYVFTRKFFRKPDSALLDDWQARASDGTLAEVAHTGTFDKSELVRSATEEDTPEPCDIDEQTPERRIQLEKWSRVFAVLTPLAVLGIILVMVLPSVFPSLPALRGGEAAGL